MNTEKRYVIGIDFGTLSGRTVLVDTANGNELAEAVLPYPHGVMDTALPDGTALPPLWALQHPGDYLAVLRETVPAVLRDTGIPGSRIAGLGLDFTSCTLLPVDRNATPLGLRSHGKAGCCGLYADSGKRCRLRTALQAILCPLPAVR